jgi:hypothetical protein
LEPLVVSSVLLFIAMPNLFLTSILEFTLGSVTSVQSQESLCNLIGSLSKKMTSAMSSVKSIPKILLKRREIQLT